MRSLGDRIFGPSGGRRRRAQGLLGGKRRRRVLLGTLASTVALAAFLVSNASAVHDLVFQLDGDVSASTTTSVGGTTQPYDWDSLFNADGTKKTPPTTDFTASSGVLKDFNNTGTVFHTNDQTTFATGSKDTLPITPGWQCNFDNNVNSKIDVMNAYAAAYTDPVTDHEILYFGLERNTNTGDGNVAFWFLQSPVACESEGGNHPFTGEHQDGDLLVVSAFTNGGTVSNVDVYRWDRPDPDLPGSLNPNPVIEDGSDCRTTGTASPEDDACAIVNTGTLTGTTAIPWLTANKQDGVGHTLRSTEFYEGGVDLTAHELGGRCFNTFLADTRSSQSLTATLFDYASGQLGECAAGMATQVSDAGPVLPKVEVHDTATVTGNKEITPTGEVTFFLCGPIATGACTTGGTQLTNVAPQGTLAPVTSTATLSDASANSPDVNTDAAPLAPGRYCFRAEWPGDDNYTTPLKEFGGENGTNECFTVQDTSSITTAQQWLPNDTATVTLASGGTPSGTVEFKLYTKSGTCVDDPNDSTDVTTFSDSSAPFETNNTTVYTASTIVSWSATFTPTAGSGVVGSTTTRCERSDLTIDNSASPFPPTP
jgi:hypothetical protein